MSRRNLISAFVLGLACGLIALPSPARADRDTPARPARGAESPRSPGAKSVAAPPASQAPAAAQASERTRLAAELERINAEIDALKRSPRGIRDDYRLRNRMADAEAVARRLTELEARSGPARAPEGGGAPAALPREVPVGAADDRADLEAKADILADEAGRLTAEANRIETRALDLRARRELRRRAGQLERDPFSPLEQAKSRVVTGTTVPQAAQGSKNGSGPPRTGGPTLGTEGSSPATPTASPGGTMTAGDSSGGNAPPTTNTFASGSASPQSLGVLDPTLLAEVRRLEGPGAPSANLTTLETAVATLRARSSELARRAAALRARAAARAY